MNNNNNNNNNIHINHNIQLNHNTQSNRNNSNNDIICLNHNSEYLYICKNCYCLICIKCLTSNHKSHEIAEISITNIKSIIKEFKNHHIYTLNSYLKSDKVVLNSANHCIQDIQSKYKKNKQDIDNDFNQLFQILKQAQQEVQNKLDLEFKKNLEYYEKLKCQIESDEKVSKPIINNNYNQYREINFSDDAHESIQKLNIGNSTGSGSGRIRSGSGSGSKINNINQLYNSNNNNNNNYNSSSSSSNDESSSDDDNNNSNNNNNQQQQKYNRNIKYYPILKDALTTRNLIDERIERSRSNNNNHESNCGSPLKSLKNSTFKDFSISFNQDTFNQIKEILHSKLNNLLVAKLSNYQDPITFHHNMVNKKFSIGSRQFYLTNGEPIHMDIEHIALSNNIDIVSAHNILNCTSSTFKSLFFSNGFPHPISPNIIPESIESLFVCGIKHTLVRDSIPLNVKNLFLFDGFNQEPSHDFIPQSISSLSIYNILYPIEAQSIPKSITKLSLHDYQFEFVPDLISSSITNLLVGNTKYPIQHIPDSVLEITFFEGYSHQIDSNTLPSSLLRLTLSKIKYPLIKGSLPSSLREISFIGFNHTIIGNDIIPPSVTLISLGQISEPLNIHSIPDTVEIIQFLDSFNHKIQKETIKNVKTISFYDIKYPLCNNSIPSSVKEIHFQDNFGHLIIPGTIPSSVETIFINNIKQSLLEGSIPNTTKQVYIDKYFHQLLPGHLPFSISKLIIGDIDPLIIGSIPPTINMVQISLDYKYKIDNTIPPGVKVINCQE